MSIHILVVSLSAKPCSVGTMLYSVPIPVPGLGTTNGEKKEKLSKCLKAGVGQNIALQLPHILPGILPF